MYCGDLRHGHQIDLPLEMAVIGLRHQSLCNSIGNFQPKLTGCRIGEGDDQKFMDIFALTDDAIHNPIHQNLGLTGACRGGNKQGAALIVHNSLLLRGKSVFSHPLHLRSFPKIPWHSELPDKTAGGTARLFDKFHCNHNTRRDRDFCPGRRVLQ